MSKAVIATAKAQSKDTGDIHTLSTGVCVRLRPVPPSLINDVMLRVPVPEVPVFWNEQKGREEKNPSDPGYAIEVERYGQARGAAAMDAVIMFGIELLDDSWKTDTGWVTKLKILNVEFDSDDPVSFEFHYKKYVAMGADDLALVMQMAGVSEEDIAKAKKS